MSRVRIIRPYDELLERERIPSVLHKIDKRETFSLQYRCPGCGIGLRVVVLPWSPSIAKHVCCKCGRHNEVKTREQFCEQLAKLKEQGEDEQKVAKRKSVEIVKP